MADTKGNRFTKYFSLLLDALRSKDPVPMRPAEATAWVRTKIDVPSEDLTRFIVNGKQTIFENDIHWARFYLAKAGLIAAPKRGLWGLTPEGLSTFLNAEQTWDLYVRVRDANRLAGPTRNEKDVPAPEIDLQDIENEPAYWFVGAIWNEKDDQLDRFIREGIWQDGEDNQNATLVRTMKPGDRIAVKASFVQQHKLPFDVSGKRVSCMRIKATGTVLSNFEDGRTVSVDWNPVSTPRNWYFYTYRSTIVQADQESQCAVRLIDFAFRGTEQDYAWFLSQPYWKEKYGEKLQASVLIPDHESLTLEDLLVPVEEPKYEVNDIIEDGSFLSATELTALITRWREKKNLILQGPPGTGKTWLAKRLGFVLVGSNNREAAKSRLRIVQFHPSLSYEDFVRGLRPGASGTLELTDGIFMQAIDAAKSEPDLPFVLVIEEINRGNPAQIFGEMLTLLENTKRKSSEGMELAYRKEPGERIYIPQNLYVIGTMNVADRSLAIVDLALRRRFAFHNLSPTFGTVWQKWCAEKGIEQSVALQIESRIQILNKEISTSPSLGPQFQIGHSFVTPEEPVSQGQCATWFQFRVEGEIGPVLDEYWYDDPERAAIAKAKLLAPLLP